MKIATSICIVSSISSALLAAHVMAVEPPKGAAPRGKKELVSAESESPTAKARFRFRKLATIPTRNKDDFRYAAIDVSMEQKAAISRNFLVSRGEDIRNRVGAYLWRLDPADPKRTKLPDSTNFGFIPDSHLAYQVHWGSGVRFWDTRTHATSGDYLPHALREDTSISPAVSPDGKVMVTRSQLDHLQFWNVETRKPITPEITQTGIVYKLEFSADGKWFFAKTPKNLTIWEAASGKLVAGPVRHDIYYNAYSDSNKRLITAVNNSKDEEVWRSDLVVRKGPEFTETERISFDGRARQTHWLGDKHLLVVADNKAPGARGPFSYGQKILYLISLGAQQAKIQTLLEHDWIRGVSVSPNQRHFFVRTRQETSCWKLGVPKPVWTQPGDHLVSFGDKDWVLLHNGPLIARSLKDGQELWRKDDVGKAKAMGANIWACNENEIEIWRVER